MYKITSNTRRVTQRMVDESYKWLYKRILDGGYHMNRCLEGEALIISMQEEGGVSRESYDRFVELTESRPFFYMLNYKKSSKRRRITTDEISNYFIEFNGSIFPIGFLMDFFEDDYETREEIHSFIKTYITDEKEKLFVQFKKEIVNKNIRHEELLDSSPSIFKTKISFFVWGAIKLIFLGVMIHLFLGFLEQSRIIPVTQLFFEGGMVFKAPVVGNIEPVTAYMLNGEYFSFSPSNCTFGEYYFYFLPHLIFNVFLLLSVLIGRVTKAITWLVGLGYVIVSRTRILIQNLNVKMLEKSGFAEIQEYFDTIIDELCDERQVTASAVENIPKARRYYVRIANFDIDRMSERIKKAVSDGKLLRAVSLNYTTEEEFYLCRHRWRAGFGTGVFWLLISVGLNQPDVFNLIATNVAKILFPGS